MEKTGLETGTVRPDCADGGNNQSPESIIVKTSSWFGHGRRHM